MWLLLWIIQSFLASFWMILTKKVVENKAVWNNWQTFISRSNHTIFLVLLFLITAYVYEIKSLSLNINSEIFNMGNM